MAILAVCLLLTLSVGLAVAQESGQASGRIAFLRIQGVGETDQGADVVIRLEGQGDRLFGFDLTGSNQPSHRAMFDLIRDAYFNDHEITIAYLATAESPIYQVTAVWLPAVPVDQAVLPANPPEEADLEFVIPDERFDGDALFPPEIANATDVEIIAIRELPTIVTAADRTDLLRAALADDAVREALGESYEAAVVEQFPIDAEPEKQLPEALAASAVTRGVMVESLTFFSYSTNVVVRAYFQESQVIFVERIEPSIYQPPETAGEVERAVELARAELGDRVAELTGRAILAYPLSDEGEAGFYDQRVLYVAFYERADEGPLFTALVDLTNNQVISAGPAQ